MVRNIVPINRMNKFFLYGLYCPTNMGLKYIGITKGTLENRLKSHLRKPTNFKTKKWFNKLKDINKTPIIKPILYFDDYDELLKAEIKYIKEEREKGTNLLNISDGGDLNPMLNKTHSLEARNKISKATKGRNMSELEKNKRRKKLKELWGDEEWSSNVRGKMSKNMINNKRALGFKHSKETKRFLSKLYKNNNYNLGNKHSSKTKEYLSLINSGENNPMYNKTISEESKIKRLKTIRKNKTFKGSNNPNYKFIILEKELKNLFINKNLTIKQLSDLYGCSTVTITNKLKEFNIKKGKSNKYNLNYKDIINYKKQGLNLIQIGEIYGCSNKIISKYIKKHE